MQRKRDRNGKGDSFVIDTLKAVSYQGPEYMVKVTWQDGHEESIDLTSLIFTYKIYRPLRKLALFKQVERAEFGYGLSWPDRTDLDISPDQLADLARTQSQRPNLRPSFFRAWHQKMGITYPKIAAIIGKSDRALADYATGKTSLDSTLVLALSVIDPGLAKVTPENIRSLDPGEASAFQWSLVRQAEQYIQASVLK